jgi:hypothetical protein
MEEDEKTKPLSQEELAALTRQRDQLRGLVHQLDARIKGQPTRANRHSRRAADVAERRAARKLAKTAARAAFKERVEVAALAA